MATEWTTKKNVRICEDECENYNANYENFKLCPKEIIVIEDYIKEIENVEDVKVSYVNHEIEKIDINDVEGEENSINKGS